MRKYTNKEINELRKEVKEQTGYNLKQIDITSFSADNIVYTIYKDYENDRRTGRQPITSGRINRTVNMEKLILTYKGMDSSDRPVYEDKEGNLWKDIDPRKDWEPDLCTSCQNAFDGEPDINMKYIKNFQDADIEFVPERITW